MHAIKQLLKSTVSLVSVHLLFFVALIQWYAPSRLVITLTIELKLERNETSLPMR